MCIAVFKLTKVGILQPRTHCVGTLLSMSQFTCLNLRLSLPSMLSEPILVMYSKSLSSALGGGEGKCSNKCVRSRRSRNLFAIGVVLMFVWKMDLLIFQHNIRNPYLLWIHKNLLYSFIIHRFPLKERIIPYLQKSGKNRVLVFSKTNYGALFCLSLSKVAYIIFLRL